MMKDKELNILFDKRVEYARSILGDEDWVTYEWTKEYPYFMFIECRDLGIREVYNLTDSLNDFTDELFKLKNKIQAERDKNEILDQSDNVNHPSHYKQGNIECIDAMRQQFTKEEVVAFCKLNAFKYLWRANHKGTHQQDIDKAEWYLNQISSTYVKGE